MGVWLGIGMTIFLFQLILAGLIYFFFRKRLSGRAISVTILLLSLAIGFWAANRILMNFSLRDLVDAEEQRTKIAMTQTEKRLFTAGMRHNPELKSAVYQHAFAMSLPGALIITLAGFLVLRRRLNRTDAKADL
jgi:hypothetical protein